MENVFDVANFFLLFQDEDCEDYISNLKLQYLCYYAQGFHLAINDCRLFNEDIEAWSNGTVIRVLHDKYEGYKDRILPIDKDFYTTKLTLETRDLLSKIYNKYGQYATWKLRNMVREDLPWRKAVENNDELIIPDQYLKEYFKKMLWVIRETSLIN